jgi:LysM repeat protein
MAPHPRRRAPVLVWLAPLMLLALTLPAPLRAGATVVVPRPIHHLPDLDEPGEGPPVTYIAQPGDSLYRIAQRFNTRVVAVRQANRLGEAGSVTVGQRLVIPVLPSAQLVNPPNPRRGLAMAVTQFDDLTHLGVAWYYTWQWCTDPGCVPMVYDMQNPPTCAPIILVGNEPNAVRPFGSPVTATLAAQRVRAIEVRCPHSQLVVGNVSADDWSSQGGTGSGRDWLLSFLNAYRLFARRDFHQTLGVHCYAQSEAQYCLDRLAELRATYAGTMWVTEFGIISGSPEQFDILLNSIAAHFDRFAAYTNRQPHTGQGWELSSGVEMVHSNGSFTPLGEVYANWPQHANSQMR